MGDTADIDPELAAALSVFKHFFDVTHIPIAILDNNGKHIYYNKENAELDGCRREDVLGKHMLDSFPNIKERDNGTLKVLREGIEYIDRHMIYYTARGKLVNYLHTTVPLFNKNKEIIGVIERGNDLSNTHHLYNQIVMMHEKLYKNSEEDKYKIIYASPQIEEVLNKSERLAAQDIPIIIVGESGTGKELIARFIHNKSQRKNKPFIALNCAAIPNTLFEGTFFGSLKGSFTGAKDYRGFLEMANGGTLFLDEINSMPYEIQSKLLRFLQEKTFWKLGGNKEEMSDVRIIAAMNESPFEKIRQNQLRADLYYRLEVGMIVIPPLRNRKKDILFLANYFLKKHKSLTSQAVNHLSDEVKEQLLTFSWTGNVRMLENVIIRSLIMHENSNILTKLVFNDEVEVDYNLSTNSEDIYIERVKNTFKNEEGQYLDGEGINERIQRYERAWIVQTLCNNFGNISDASRVLKISRGSLQYKLKKYNIQLELIEKA